MVTNILHYRTNYIFLCFIICVFRLILAPYLIVTFLFCFAFSFYGKYVLKAPFTVQGVVVTDKMKDWIILGVNALILLWLGVLSEGFWMAFYCSLVVGLHALLRPRSITAKTNKVYEEFKVSSGMSSLWSSGNGPSNEAMGGPDDPEAPLLKEDVPDGLSYPNSQSQNENMRKRQGNTSAKTATD